jgi:hypothetical protein
VEGRRNFYYKKWEHSLIAQASTRGWLASSGRLPAAGQRLTCYTMFPFFEKNLLIFIFIFWKFGEWARAFGKMGVQYPHFLKLAPTLGSVKCSIPHGDWRFHFFSNFIFAKFKVHLDLHFYYWDFCFMKN